MTTQYPECEKLSEKREEIDHLTDFVAFLAKQGIILGEWLDSGYHLKPISNELTPEVLAAKFYGIDMNTVQKERAEIERTIRS